MGEDRESQDGMSKIVEMEGGGSEWYEEGKGEVATQKEWGGLSTPE